MIRRLGIAGAIAAACLSGAPASADVWVAGNGETLDVLVYGNSSDTEDRMAEQSSAIGLGGWQHIWQGEPGQTGWLAVSCVRKADGEVHFEIATEQPTRSAAFDRARSAAQQFISGSGGSLIENCGGSIDNAGQKIEARLAFGMPAATEPAPPPAEPVEATAPETTVADSYGPVPVSPAQDYPSQDYPAPEPISSQFPAGWTLHLEAVTVCEFVLPQSRDNAWRCMGPSSIAYVDFNGPDALVQLRKAGSNLDGSAPRDLGKIGRFYVFAWGEPLFDDPDKVRDAALRMGVPPIDQRLRYWCPPGQNIGCLQE